MPRSLALHRIQVCRHLLYGHQAGHGDVGHQRQLGGKWQALQVRVIGRAKAFILGAQDRNAVAQLS